MHFTIFKTPVIRSIFKYISIVLLKITGWKLEGRFPKNQKCVVIVAPHTSNWDFFYGLLLVLSSGINTYWIGKASLFKFPFGPVMKWLGGIPVDRSKNNNMVAQAAENFSKNSNLAITVPPEGSRSTVSYWKSGFYFIALKADVPILLGFLDFAKKRGGFGPLFYPTGNIEADMSIIRGFYADIRGRYPEKETPARISPHHYQKEIS
ncbi:MAG: glycerol acyltransferase [Spirochaetae bacterium HGW-Spirochaetae-1]|jgi:1-acyl-sn-glycerol-3-phosphate acyltransferase|nr:MAG: glycerol acyltransferase [Spirochaetae bacterium HGW-Spirochaetae-1]